MLESEGMKYSTTVPDEKQYLKDATGVLYKEKEDRMNQIYRHELVTKEDQVKSCKAWQD